MKRTFKKSLAAALLLNAVIYGTSALAATCVPPTPNGAGLQACLDSTAPGDTIRLSAGTYVPPNPLVYPAPQGRTFFINKRLTIRGVGPGVVLSGNLGGGLNTFNVVIINADADPGLVHLDNVTIEGGDSSTGGFTVGGGIAAAPNQTVTLTNVRMENNYAVLGAAIWPGGGPDSFWTIENSDFLNNHAVSDGGAIRATGTQSLSISGGRFDGNVAGGLFGGAVHFNSFGSLAVSGVTFENNESVESGGAMAIQGVGVGQTYAIDRSVFRYNRTTSPADGFGGAVDIFNIINEGSVRNSNFHGNSASQGGGAIWIDNGHATLASNTFSENSSYFGGAIGIVGDGPSGDRSTNVTVTDSRFVTNSATEGGAVFAYDVASVAGGSRKSGLTLEKNLFQTNSASQFGGAVLVVGSENLVINKENYDFNWSDNLSGGLLLFNIASGSASNLFFNQNDAGVSADSLFLGAASVDLGLVQVAEEDEEDCVVNGSVGCP